VLVDHLLQVGAPPSIDVCTFSPSVLSPALLKTPSYVYIVFKHMYIFSAVMLHADKLVKKLHIHQCIVYFDLAAKAGHGSTGKHVFQERGNHCAVNYIVRSDL
jgi:hypothetical protein